MGGGEPQPCPRALRELLCRPVRRGFREGETPSREVPVRHRSGGKAARQADRPAPRSGSSGVPAITYLSVSCDMFDPMNSLPFSRCLRLPGGTGLSGLCRWRCVWTPGTAEPELLVILLSFPPSPGSAASRRGRTGRAPSPSHVGSGGAGAPARRGETRPGSARRGERPGRARTGNFFPSGAGFFH